MPIYKYKHSETQEEKDVFLSVAERDSYKGENGDDENWKRQFSAPYLNIDSSSSIDPFDEKDFKKVTENKNGTVGDLLDLSEELSERRAEKNGGVDPVKKSHYDRYEKKTGKKHQDDKIKVVEKNGIKIEMDD